MTKVKVIFEVDFKAIESLPCELCGRLKSAHFQPPSDADPNLAAHWCPAPGSLGDAGRFTSFVYRRPKVTA